MVLRRGRQVELGEDRGHGLSAPLHGSRTQRRLLGCAVDAAVAAAFGALVPIPFAGDALVEEADVVYRLVGGSFAAFGLIAWQQ
jgi:hypothetical protein